MHDQMATVFVVKHLNRAAAHHDGGHVTRDDVDIAMRLGCALPYGPLARLDELGIDVAGVRRASILTRMARDGRLGPRRRRRLVALPSGGASPKN